MKLRPVRPPASETSGLENEYAGAQQNEHMTNVLIAVILLLLLVILAGSAVIFIRTRAKLQELEAEFRSFVTAADEKTPSPLASLVQTAGEVLGRSIVNQVRTSLMGSRSGEVRADQAITGDIAEGQALQNPLVAAALQASPALKKTIRRNPALLDLVMSKLATMGSAAPAIGSRPSNNGSGSAPQFKL